MPLGPPNMAPTVLEFSTPYTRRRRAAPTVNADGLDVDGAATDTTILAHVFESGGGPERMPEGIERGRIVEGHVAEGQAGIASPVIRTADEQSGAVADEIIVDGEALTVFEVNDFREGPTGAVMWRQFFAAKVVRP